MSLHSASTFLFLLAALPGLQAAVELVESGGGLQSPGGTVSLLCKASGFTFSDFWMFWVRQAPGKGLEWVAGIRYDGSKTRYSASVQGRCSISRDNSQASLSLQLSSLQEADSGTYFCARYITGSYWAAGIDAWGPGVVLTVTSVPPTSPSVFPLATCSGTSPATLGCLANSYLPQPVSFSWEGPGSLKPRLYPAVSSQSGLSRSSSILEASLEGTSQQFRCTVSHQPTRFQKTIEVTASASPQAPTSLSLLHSCDPTSASVQLLCLVSGFRPLPLHLDWLEDGIPLSPAPPRPLPQAEGDSGTFSLQSSLNVTLEEWQEKVFSCRVSHPASAFSREVTDHKCLSSPADPASIRVFILPPSPADLYISQAPRLRCLASSLPSDEGLTFSWTHQPVGEGRASNLRPYPLRLVPNYNGTFTATSEVPVTTAAWERGDTFGCTLNHRDLPSPIVRTIQRKQDQVLPPSVYLLAPPLEELSSSRSRSSSSVSDLSLTCLIRGFYPEDISISWLKNQEVLEASSYVNSAPQREVQGGSSSSSSPYFLYSRLGVGREEWERGDTFVCMVVHQGLPMRFVQRSISRSPGRR